MVGRNVSQPSLPISRLPWSVKDPGDMRQSKRLGFCIDGAGKLSSRPARRCSSSSSLQKGLRGFVFNPAV